jgi:hypothetical protein
LAARRNVRSDKHGSSVELNAAAVTTRVHDHYNGFHRRARWLVPLERQRLIVVS